MPFGRRARSLLLLTLTVFVGLAGCRQDDGPTAGGPTTDGPTTDGRTIWRFAIEEPRGSVQDAYAQAFKERIESASDGRIEVKVYPYGTLGTSDQLTELVYEGTVQLAMASPGHLGKLIPPVQVFLLHYLLTGDSKLDREILRDPALRELMDGYYREKGFRLLTFYSEGEQVWTTTSKVRTPADFDGVKMRVMTSPLLIASYDAYGASSTPLPYSEVYSALQLNMIDAQVNPVFAIYEMSFFEVTDFLIYPGHAQFITSAMASDAFYKELSDDDRALLDKTIADMQPVIDEIQRAYNGDRLAKIKEKKPDIKIVRLKEAERVPFIERSKEVRGLFVEQTGPRGEAALDALLAAVARVEAEAAAASAEREVAQPEGDDLEADAQP